MEKNEGFDGRRCEMSSDQAVAIVPLKGQISVLNLGKRTVALGHSNRGSGGGAPYLQANHRVEGPVEFGKQTALRLLKYLGTRGVLSS
jgi:hypothetical protein